MSFTRSATAMVRPLQSTIPSCRYFQPQKSGNSFSLFSARQFSSSSSQRSSPYIQGKETGPLTQSSSSTSTPPSNSSPTLQQVPLTPEQQDYLHAALRVNHAGELAAVRIYAAQHEPVVRLNPSLRTLMTHMADQEKHHFSAFQKILPDHQVRPSALYPVWSAAAHTLGWVTGLMGKEAAMACTEAVETVIGHHYNDQIRRMAEWEEKLNMEGKTLGPEMKDLLTTLRKFRDDELEHLDHAVVNDAQEAKPYELLTEIIKGGCRGAIFVAKRI